MKKLNFLSISLIFLLITNCGFKVENLAKLNNFAISEITTSGDQRINYRLKNSLSFKTAKNSEKLIMVDLTTNKNKTIKEKNIKNEIIKYKIEINVIVVFNEINSDKNYTFVVSKSSDYDVSSQYSQTLNNEKKLIEQLTDNLTKEIFDKLVLKVNAI